MLKEKKPLLTDEFLDAVEKEISDLYGVQSIEENEIPSEGALADQ
ncbi:bacitracin ABC transporter ATP-binding protein [Metabacillus sp. KIGAM252]|uniref:Bacitracin ABC transporter ATP-binding protein n=1 Tax=Metabacillus flavus TaxID=2823519 RepID=A0ABS5LCH6_9BACI|nr:hypothetical protein [Metabacillus flavus]MBS2968324.1 bacitracin ABC transporter ATP-binding protein [Metabacillus flavus]